ncbi:MAG: hypothetical protein IPN34_04695 [Planctomycetes bacterium]|nr:hypothetical protein [Planctomycetota bacterium]
MSEVEHEEIEHVSLFRRYQRPILLGLVIFALLTFSITSAALMMFETDPSEVAIVLPDGSSATVGGRAEQELDRASLGIVRQIAGQLTNYKDMLDRAGEESMKSNQVLQSLQEFREFDVWVPFLNVVDAKARRNRDGGLSYDDYVILSGAAQAAGIRVGGDALEEKKQALLQLVRASAGEQGADFAADDLYRMFGMREAGFDVALARSLAATELVRRLELGLEAIPTPEEVLADWKKKNPQVRATVAVFAASLYEEEARRVFELLFSTEEERQAEIRRWKDPAGGSDAELVDDQTKQRREKLRTETIDKRKDAADLELAQATDAASKAPNDEAAAARVRAARREQLWLAYLDKLVDRRTRYGATSGEEEAPSGKDALRDFEGRRWLLFGLDLDALTDAQNEFLLGWIKEKGIEEPTLKEVAEHYRKYAYSRFLTEEGRLARNIARWTAPAGGAMPRTQEGAASGSGAGQGGNGENAAAQTPAGNGQAGVEGGQTGPAPAVPAGMLATSDRPDQMASKDIQGWDDPGVQKRAKADLVAKRFLGRFRDVVVGPALEDATSTERKAFLDAEAAAAEKAKAVEALLQRSREINTELNRGGDGRGMQGYLDLDRSEESARTNRREKQAQLERLEKLTETQRESDYAQKLDAAKKGLAAAEQELQRATEARRAYLVDGLPRVQLSLLNGRAAGVASALGMLGFGDLVAKSGEPAPADAAATALTAVWNALAASEQTAVGGSAAWDAADADGKLALLVRATNSAAAHPQAQALDAAWRAVGRAKLSAILSPLETKRAELQGLVGPALSSVSEGVERLAALRAEIPGLDASIEAQDRSLAAKREEVGRATDPAAKAKLEEELKGLEAAREAQNADRAKKLEERAKIEGEMTTRQQSFETQRAAAFDASSGWASSLGGLEAALKLIEDAEPSIASLSTRSAAVEAAEKKLADAEAAKADLSALDKLRVELASLVERRLEAYEKRRTLSSQSATRASEVTRAFAEWRQALDPAHATTLQGLLAEYNEWGPKNVEAKQAQTDAQAAVDAARNAVEVARVAALPVVLERLRGELRAQSGAAAVDLVAQEIPGWVTREDLAEDFARNSSDLPEGGGNPILEGALFGPGNQLEEGGLGKDVAISQRYALLPGLLDAGGESATDALARRAYLRELALEIARIRAAICSEMLDEIERVDETPEEKTFAAGSEVKRESFERELREGEAFYFVKGAGLPSQEIRFQRYFASQGRGYYRWSNGPLNPDWFRKVTSLPVRRTFDALTGALDDVEGEVLSSQPFEHADLEAWFVAHIARRPLDPEVDGVKISPREWTAAFRELREERLAKAVQASLIGEGLRKVFQIARR